MKKKQWNEWAAEYVQRTQRCPGNTPSFGLPTDLVTEDEFQQSVKAGGTHPWDDCHYVEEMLGTKPPDDFVPIKTDDTGLRSEVRKMEGDVGEVMLSKRIAALKETLHTYVDRIQVKGGSKVYIPPALFDAKTFISKYLNQ